MNALFKITFNEKYRDIYVVAEGFDDAKRLAERQICSLYSACPLITNIALLASETGSPSPDLPHRPPSLFVK
ncbi:hypothetical protein MASR1M12_00170 [Erysipelotrichia bacterium]